MKVFAAEPSNDDKVLYLSDKSRIQHDAGKSKADRNKLFFNQNDAGDPIRVKIEGAWYTFENGIYAHGPSYIAYNVSEFSQKYEYFSAYGGLLPSATKSDGALFYFQTSEDGSKWVTQAPSDTSVTTDASGRQLVKYNQNALYFTYKITGVKWIRLVADKNSSNAQDYVVWADAKLTTTPDEGGAVMPLTEYDKQIKAKVANGADLNDKDLELLILQREFVSRVGQYALKRFKTQCGEDNEAHQEVLEWLLYDLDSLREFMLGGTPFKGNYYNSLTVLSDLYKSYKTDLDDKTLLGYNHSGNKWMPDRTFGELCRTMMFSVALTHDGAIGSYLQGSKPQNKSYPLQRYAIFKYMYQTERFVATRNADGSWKSETMSWFESYRVEEMRWLMCNIIDDESILWLNDQVQTRINTNPNNVGKFYDPYTYVKYTSPNYNNPVFYADENHDYFNKQFAVDYRGDNAKENGDDKIGTRIGMFDTKYVVPAGEGQEPYEITISYSKQGEPKLQKVWMNFSNKFGTGSVCGGISKSGSNIRTVRGIPAHVIGQPGHAAILYYGKDANGKGSWKIDNDVGGWLAATKGERHLLGWGNASWQRNSGGTVVYFHLAQACLNDYDNLVKAEEYTWLVKVYAGDLDKQEALYEKALSTQILNLDAWYGLVMTYKANTTKTAANFVTLAARIGDTYYNHPMAMHCLFKLFGVTTGVTEVDAALTDPLFTTQLKTIEINTLAKTKAQGSTAAKSKVSYLLGNVDLAVADFSFDGENAGCIVWADTYKDGSFTWYYSVDGKKTWKEVTFSAGDNHAYPLPEKDLASISTENDIYVYVKGASPDTAYRIDVAAKPTMPDTLYANDWENRVIGVDGTYEWRYCTATETETETGTEVTYTPVNGWISYAEASPDCSGDKIIEVRLKGTAKKPASDGRIFTFTADTDTAERKYISINYLSVEGYSTQPKDTDSRKNYAVNAIDGNAKTYWHTDYDINIKNTVADKDGNPKPYEPAFIIIKIDVPRWISGLEFAQNQYNPSFSIFAKDVAVWVSEDGENWGEKPAATREGFEEIDDLKVVHFDEPVYGQYVKLEMTALYETNTSDGVFTTVSMINLYEDTTKTTSPYGDVMQSLSEIAPNKDLFAGLGGIIDEQGALELGGLPDETGATRKSNNGLLIALSVVGGVIIATAVVVFVLYTRGIIKITDKNDTEKGSTPKASATDSKVSTAKSKASATKSKASTAKSKANATNPKVSTTKSKTSTTKPKSK
ncbi:MAG: NPCBM/NEW2 domain-containing protein [Clostridia bacterium]|nr:NPCBM/NEW2 domain-containing protein [Clostridia bacterium]